MSDATKKEENKKTNTDVTHKEDPATVKRRNVWVVVAMMACIGVAGIIAISIKNPNFASFISNFGTGLLIAGACMSIGGLLGFIFGIPSMAQNATMSIKYNDNLVQISDWLTKIIVGVGLTQLTKIPAKISVLGIYLQDSIGIGGIWGRNAALAIVFYFLILGFLALYFWARTDYTEIVKDVDDDLQKKLEEAVKEKEEAVQQKEETKDSVISSLQKNEEQLLVTLVADGSITESDKALITALPPITVLDDPQKGRFGKLAEKNGYKLTGTVTDSTWPGYWDVLLEVSRTDSMELTDVIFLIHNTFNPAIKKVTPENFVNGKATLSLSLVYGSFTVGVITDGGKTMLELDLAGLPGVSEKFKKS